MSPVRILSYFVVFQLGVAVGAFRDGDPLTNLAIAAMGVGLALFIVHWPGRNRGPKVDE